MDVFEPLIPQMKTLCFCNLSRVIYWFHFFLITLALINYKGLIDTFRVRGHKANVQELL